MDSRTFKDIKGFLEENPFPKSAIQRAFHAAINKKKLPKDRTPAEIHSIKTLLQENLFPADPSLAPPAGQIITLTQTFDDKEHDIAYRLEKIDTSVTADYGYVYSLVPVTKERCSLLFKKPAEEEYKNLDANKVYLYEDEHKKLKYVVKDSTQGYGLDANQKQALLYDMSYEACTHLLLVGRWNNATIGNIKSYIEEKVYPKIIITASDEWQPAVELLKDHCPYAEEKDFLPFDIRKPLFSYLATKLKQELVRLKNYVKARFSRAVNFISSTLRPAALQLPPTPPPTPLTSSLRSLSLKERVSNLIVSHEVTDEEKKKTSSPIPITKHTNKHLKEKKDGSQALSKRRSFQTTQLKITSSLPPFPPSSTAASSFPSTTSSREENPSSSATTLSPISSGSTSRFSPYKNSPSSIIKNKESYHPYRDKHSYSPSGRVPCTPPSSTDERTSSFR